MKPKNRVVCPDCGRMKMLFETERKAKDFIKYNGDDIDTKGGTLRPYYCPSCCGWHVSSKQHRDYFDHNTDRLIDAYHRSISSKFNIDIVGKIMEIIPSEVKSKNQLKHFLNDYFAINCQRFKNIEGMIRHEIYKRMYEK